MAIVGYIDYLNLLPFYLYLQKSGIGFQFRKGVPSKINREFQKRKVDFAFISSIHSKNRRCGNIGIVARDEVLSVLLFEGEEKKDSASATSNRLAELLNLRGEVVIGDRALRLYFRKGGGIDLAKVWKERYRFPFVFARLCYHKYPKYIRKLEKGFSSRKISIPYYISKKVSAKIGISISEIDIYLKKISYQCDGWSRKGLNKFFYLDRFGYNPTSKFSNFKG